MRRLALTLTAMGAATLALPAAADAQSPPPPEPRIVSKLPSWLAPGGLLVVRAEIEPRERVQLLFGRRMVAEGASSRTGWFRLRGRAPRPGRYRVSLAMDYGTFTVGVLRVRPLVLAAVGDVTFGARVAEAVRAYGPRYPWLSVARTLRRADVATANLEGVVSTRGSPVPRKEFHFRGPPRALASAAGFAGIDVMSVANNHTLDYGRIAFMDTLRHAGRFGVATPGGGVNLRVARLPRLVRAGGLRILFLAYSDVRPPGFDAGPHRAGAAPAFPDLIAADVRAARRRADVTVVGLHWGLERSLVPSARQRELARVSFAAGATIVLGAHPHVLQPIVRRGRKLVAWSLGNFVFGAHSPGTERTGILRIRLTRSGVVGRSVRRARIVGIQPRLVR
jgi:poly-gamma-glutamate capsule biosynthesis protein CapA/YwtB (metallophosphatase superfamily)